MNRDQLLKFVNDHLAGGVTCQAFTEAMTDYLERRLTFGQQVRFQVHLGLCLGCRRYLRQMKQSIEVLHQLPDEPIPPHIRQEIFQRFRTWKTRVPQGSS